MIEFLKDLLYENGKPSRTGIVGLLVALVPLTVWAFITLYCLFEKYAFPHYDSMSIAVFGGSVGGAITVAYNKYLNATKNSEEGKPVVK